MSEKTRSEKFAQALQQLEQGNNEELLSMFASGSRLQRPEQDRQGAGPATNSGSRSSPGSNASLTAAVDRHVWVH